MLFAKVPALLFPYVSADYTLIHLYFPLVFFLNAPRVSRWNVAYVALFGPTQQSCSRVGPRGDKSG